MQVQRRESDLVLGTFGRGFYVLDDYSALRELTRGDARRRGATVPAARRVSVHAVGPGAGRIGRPRRPVGQPGHAQSAGGRRRSPINVREALPADTRLVLTISRLAGTPGSATRPGQGAGTQARDLESASGRRRRGARHRRAAAGRSQRRGDRAARGSRAVRGTAAAPAAGGRSGTSAAARRRRVRHKAVARAARRVAAPVRRARAARAPVVVAAAVLRACSCSLARIARCSRRLPARR